MTPRHRLTVVQVLPALDAGGVERGTLEVGKYLVEHGHRSIVISAGGRLVEQLMREGSEHVQWDIGRKSLWTLRLVPRLRRFLRENRVDILHVRSRLPAWIGYLAWQGMDPKNRPHLVTTVHGPYSVNPYSAVMTRGERVIVISGMIRDYVLKNYPGIDPGRLRLIYRGVDPAAFPYGYRPSQAWLDSWYAKFPQTRGKRLITLPARITRWKGQEDFIELIGRLKPGHPDIHGLIVGEPHPRRRQFLEELKAKVHAFGLDGSITFTGHRSDLREIMALSAIVLSLSREPEAFGRTTVEALSLGVPAIGYNHGGVGEQLAAILPDGAVPVGELDTVETRIKKWLNRPPQIPETQPFTLQRMLENTLNVYLELAQAPSYC
ncbi:glycosyltransferase involved in cell wall biosynthesis [Sulfuritortus calidifontis]|uniref:Glycosyltransferase involved in cell wall biosynthesis n=2 Tax=Sulfuritortus calidifontis TaxID=1914471 RepID=A0A4R3JXB4_9PROT|nr:glycosyltransferase involved in cell wall biosynthesis [Sulfuritortus calidifontis]